MADTFHLPPSDTAYFCDGKVLTLGEMLTGVDLDFIPRSQEDLDWLLFCFGEGIPETPLEQLVGARVM